LVSAASVVCGAPPIAGMLHDEGLHPGYRILLRLFRREPRLVHRLFSLVRPLVLWPGALRFLAPLRALLHSPDAESLEEPTNFEAVFNCQRDAFQNVDGLFADAGLYAEPWGFPPEEIRVPVQFWHGREDRNFHFSLAGHLAARVPSATLRVVENEGHFSLPIRRAETILAALAEAC
jgi:pimeloyl-ACP methyl ester carboxylesterase